jgi:hypothetical protein
MMIRNTLVLRLINCQLRGSTRCRPRACKNRFLLNFESYAENVKLLSSKSMT